MDTKLKTNRLSALRGGRYKQAQGCLRDPDGFCCLGVLLDVAALGEWLDADAGIYEIDGVGFDGDLGSHCGTVGLTKEQQSILVDMNDGERTSKGDPKTFDQIAAYIEANL